MQTNSLNHGDTETRRNFFLRAFASPWFFRVLLWLAPILFLLSYFFLPLSKILILAFNTSALTKANFQLILPIVSFTFYQAALSTILTFILGIPSAILFSRFNFRGKPLLRALTAVPFMLPTVVVASSFNALFGNHGLFSSSLRRCSGQAFHYLLNLQLPKPLLFTDLACPYFYNTTIVIRLVGNALSRLDPKLEGAARSLGADSLRVWRHITLPLLRPSLFAAALLVFMFDFTSFGVILLLGGSNFSTLEVEIYLRVLKLPNLPLAALLSIIQLLFTLIFSILYTRIINQVTAQTNPRFSASRPPKTPRTRFVFTLYALLITFFLLPSSLPSLLTRLEATADNAAKSNMASQPITTKNFSSIGVDHYFMFRQFKPREILSVRQSHRFTSLALGYPAAYALAKPTRLENFSTLSS